MPEEEIQHQPEPQKDKSLARPLKKKHTLMIVLICVVVAIGLLSLGGYLGYRYYKKQQQVKKEKQIQAQIEAEKKVVESKTLKEVNAGLLFTAPAPVKVGQ